MTVNGHWQYKLTIPVHIFCVNEDDLRQILFDLWQNGFKLMSQAIMQRGILLNISNKNRNTTSSSSKICKYINKSTNVIVYQILQ